MRESSRTGTGTGLGWGWGWSRGWKGIGALRAAVVAGVLTGVTACAPVKDAVQWAMSAPPAPATELTEGSGRTAAPVVAQPADAPPGVKGDRAAWERALAARGDRIVVSREARRLWLMDGDSAVFTAPVAVGRDTIFRYGGKAYDFNTPSGRFRVQGKEEAPEWVPPDWHYFEKAVEQDLEPVQLTPGSRIELSDGTTLEVRGTQVGRINRFGNWRAFTPGSEIVFDDKIFIPPFGSPQRRIPRVLGTHRLILGDGYLIHGTPETDSIGEYASHGCVRMFNRDVEHLYGLVQAGVAVYIY